jgi:hypothetical protein
VGAVGAAGAGLASSTRAGEFGAEASFAGTTSAGTTDVTAAGGSGSGPAAAAVGTRATVIAMANATRVIARDVTVNVMRP